MGVGGFDLGLCCFDCVDFLFGGLIVWIACGLVCVVFASLLESVFTLLCVCFVGC